MRRAWAIALVLVSLVALSPLAVADHAYSHRYVVYGRLVDADGAAVTGAAIGAAIAGPTAGGSCAPAPNARTEAFGETHTRLVTDERGEFILCAHLHAFHSGMLQLSVGEERTWEFPLDPDFRVNFVRLALGAAVDGADHAINAGEHLVMGRAWTPGMQTVEGVPVHGDVVKDAVVKIHVVLADGAPIEVGTTTDGYGDFAVRVPIPEGSTVVRATANVQGSNGRPVAQAPGWSPLLVRVTDDPEPLVEADETASPAPVDGAPSPTPGAGAPGDERPTPALGFFVVGLAAVVVALATRRFRGR